MRRDAEFAGNEGNDEREKKSEKNAEGRAEDGSEEHASERGEFLKPHRGEELYSNLKVVYHIL